MKGTINDFKKELGELLKKYDVDIWAEVNGYTSEITIDTHGNSDDEQYKFTDNWIDYKDLLSENK